MGIRGTAGIFPHAAIPVNLPAVSVLRLPLSPVTRVLSREVRITGVEGHDYVCLTDIARYRNPEASDDLIRNWLRNRNTIEFLGIWEQINNPGFNPVEFDGIKKVARLNSFTLTPKQWIELPAQISTSM
jgi:hypothetical protein